MTLSLILSDGSIPSYLPGQCITVQAPCPNLRARRQYSISSAPGEKALTITVRAMGACSSKICSLGRGGRLMASPPHGIFPATQPRTSLVMLAGGIGITPFRSIIFEAVRQTPQRNLLLLHSAQTRQGLVFEHDLSRLSKTHRALRVKYFITREQVDTLEVQYRRMRTEDVLEECSDSAEREFLICGSTSFICGQQQSLRQAGVLNEHIHTECFF